MRPPDLHRVHDARAGRPALPRSLREAAGAGRVTAGAQRTAFEGTGALVTKALIAVNIVVYVITAAQGQGINNPGGSLYFKWILFGPSVANGDWWRLITSTFLHANILHIGLNMYFLWFVGSAVESVLGRGGSCSSTSSRASPAPRARSWSIRGRRPSAPPARSSGSSARRSCSSGSASTCSAGRRWG